MELNKMKITPPQTTALSKEDFINAANKEMLSIAKQKSLPWEESYVRDDVKKSFTVHLPESYIIKLQFIKEITNKSQQKVVRTAVCSAVDDIISHLIKI